VATSADPAGVRKKGPSTKIQPIAVLPPGRMCSVGAVEFKSENKLQVNHKLMLP
jgi:hypothetical protein